jgi:multidrug resistance efflux pump
MVRWLTYILAALGLVIAVYAAATATHEAPRVPLAGEPSVNPFRHGIAATGIVEAASRNIAVAAPDGGQVTRVFVEVGDRVARGEPLFEVDPRPIEAELVTARAARDSAVAELARLEAQPRAETIPPLEAAVKAAEVEVNDSRSRVELWESVKDKRAVAEDELNRYRFALEGAQARLAQARANLELARAGAWSKDIDVARAGLEQAEAQVRAVEILLERRTVRAPIDGTVLKRNVEPGQLAPTDPARAAVTMGDLSSINIRAQVDEEDLPELRKGAAAVARIRGGRDITVRLEMLRIEPLAEPKVSLSGATTERVDTRVLEVLFVVKDAGDAPLYPGQLVDVFIEGPAPEESAPGGS